LSEIFEESEALRVYSPLLRDDPHWEARLFEAAPRLRSEPRQARAGRPLVVDLDGTLVRSDLLIETAFSELRHRPHAIVDMVRALGKGKANLKHRLSEPRDFDPSMLPYNPEVLRLLQAASDEGRPIYLASASHERLVSAVAAHIGLFDGWFATNATSNCAGEIKAAKLIAAFGEGGFDYIGNDAADLPVWRHAAKSYAVSAPSKVAKRLARQCDDVEHLPDTKPTWRTWMRLLRVHQYAKNLLVFVPLLTHQLFDAQSVANAVLALIAFSLCASSVYVLNDLVDLQDDRNHRSKCRRPLASGEIPLSRALLAIPILLILGLAVAAAVSFVFLGVLIAYFALTTAYSFFLKRKMVLDVMVLAGLYTMRVAGGAVAVSVWISPWLLAFIMSWFLSLALVKRYTELVARLRAELPDSGSRDYRNGDSFMVGALAAAAGMNALTSFFLYVSSESVGDLYSRPEILWLSAPFMACWMARVLMLAHRGEMNDDPVVFAIKDKLSLATFGVIGALVIGAM
jgi:4-hydroxybenzoate polyprenyltransferase/phosphoglycolate phosphatase-like HAD superfamily hydrolase